MGNDMGGESAIPERTPGVESKVYLITVRAEEDLDNIDQIAEVSDALVKWADSVFIYSRRSAIKIWALKPDSMHEGKWDIFKRVKFPDLSVGEKVTKKFVVLEEREILDEIRAQINLVAEVDQLAQEAADALRSSAAGAGSSVEVTMVDQKKRAYEKLNNIFAHPFKDVYFSQICPDSGRRGVIGLCQDLLPLAADLKLGYDALAYIIGAFLTLVNEGCGLERLVDRNTFPPTIFICSSIVKILYEYRGAFVYWITTLQAGDIIPKNAASIAMLYLMLEVEAPVVKETLFFTASLLGACLNNQKFLDFLYDRFEFWQGRDKYPEELFPLIKYAYEHNILIGFPESAICQLLKDEQLFKHFASQKCKLGIYADIDQNGFSEAALVIVGAKSDSEETSLRKAFFDVLSKEQQQRLKQLANDKRVLSLMSSRRLVRDREGEKRDFSLVTVSSPTSAKVIAVNVEQNRKRLLADIREYVCSQVPAELKNSSVSDSYDLFVMQISTDQRMDLKQLQDISQQKIPILIKQGESVYVYGRSARGNWETTLLDGVLCTQHLSFPKVGVERKLDKSNVPREIFLEIASKKGHVALQLKNVLSRSLLLQYSKNEWDELEKRKRCLERTQGLIERPIASNHLHGLYQAIAVGSHNKYESASYVSSAIAEQSRSKLDLTADLRSEQSSRRRTSAQLVYILGVNNQERQVVERSLCLGLEDYSLGVRELMYFLNRVIAIVDIDGNVTNKDDIANFKKGDTNYTKEGRKKYYAFEPTLPPIFIRCYDETHYSGFVLQEGIDANVVLDRLLSPAVESMAAGSAAQAGRSEGAPPVASGVGEGVVSGSSDGSVAELEEIAKDHAAAEENKAKRLPVADRNNLVNRYPHLYPFSLISCLFIFFSSKSKKRVEQPAVVCSEVNAVVDGEVKWREDRYQELTSRAQLFSASFDVCYDLPADTEVISRTRRLLEARLQRKITIMNGTKYDTTVEIIASRDDDRKREWQREVRGIASCAALLICDESDATSAWSICGVNGRGDYVEDVRIKTGNFLSDRSLSDLGCLLWRQDAEMARKLPVKHLEEDVARFLGREVPLQVMLYSSGSEFGVDKYRGRIKKWIDRNQEKISNDVLLVCKHRWYYNGLGTDGTMLTHREVLSSNPDDLNSVLLNLLDLLHIQGVTDDKKTDDPEVQKAIFRFLGRDAANSDFNSIQGSVTHENEWYYSGHSASGKFSKLQLVPQDSALWEMITRPSLFEAGQVEALDIHEVEQLSDRKLLECALKLLGRAPVAEPLYFYMPPLETDSVVTIHKCWLDGFIQRLEEKLRVNEEVSVTWLSNVFDCDFTERFNRYCVVLHPVPNAQPRDILAENNELKFVRQGVSGEAAQRFHLIYNNPNVEPQRTVVPIQTPENVDDHSPSSEAKRVLVGLLSGLDWSSSRAVSESLKQQIIEQTLRIIEETAHLHLVPLVQRQEMVRNILAKIHDDQYQPYSSSPSSSPSRRTEEDSDFWPRDFGAASGSMSPS